MKYRKKIFFTILSLGMLFLFVSTTANTSLAYALTNNDNKPLSFHSSDRYNWRWTNLELVSTESTGISGGPDIAVDDSRNVHVVWSDETNYLSSGSDRDIFYKKWNAVTETWSTTEVVSTISSLDSNSPSIDTDSSDNVYVVWSDLQDYNSSDADRDIFMRILDSSTSSWNTTVVVSTESTSTSDKPKISVDSTGEAYIAWEDSSNYDLSGGDIDVFFKKWDSATQSFTTTEVVSLVSSGDSQWCSIVADEQGNVFCSWVDQTFRTDTYRDLMFNKKDHLTGLWMGTEIVNEGDTLTYQYTDLTLDIQGNIHLVSNAQSALSAIQNVNHIFYTKWDITTEKWSSTALTEKDGASRSNPSVLTDLKGNIYVTWKISSSGSKQDVCMRWYDASSSVWTAIEIISPSELGSPNSPNIAIDQLGHIHFIFTDQYEYLSSGTDQDIFYRKLIGPPETPKLNPIIPIISETGNINLEWEESYGATEYYIYQSLNPIWSVEDLSPVFTTSDTNATNVLLVEDTYYYVVTASNFAGNSSVSNCVFVTYEIPHLREFAITTSIVLGIAIIAIITSRKWKKK